MVDWRLRVLGLLAATLTLAVPASASGAVTIGSTFAPNASCMPRTWVQSSSSLTGYNYAAPSAGVITAWAHQSVTGSPALRFKVVRPLGGSSFALVGDSGLTTQAGNGLNTFPIRIPVQSGDVIGFVFGGQTNYICGAITGNAFDVVHSVAGDVPSGTTIYPESSAGIRLNIAARLEPDCDSDGFGDETQDPDTSSCSPTPPGTPPPDDGTPPPDDGTPPSPEFSLGKVKKNKRKGTAKLTVEVPGAGELELTNTKKVKGAEKQADAPGKQKLRIRPKGKAKKALNRNGKARVKAKVTYTPVVGSPNTEDKKIKLVKRGLTP